MSEQILAHEESRGRLTFSFNRFYVDDGSFDHGALFLSRTSRSIRLSVPASSNVNVGPQNLVVNDTVMYMKF